jgi:hypothetical protein
LASGEKALENGFHICILLHRKYTLTCRRLNIMGLHDNDKYSRYTANG